MNKPAHIPAQVPPLHALEFDERRARYAFLSPLIEGAQVVEVLDPRANLTPATAFLEALGAASATALLLAAGEVPASADELDGLDALGPRRDGDGAHPTLAIIDGADGWLAEGAAHFDALRQLLTERLGHRANFALVFRCPAGASLEGFSGQPRRRPPTRFDFAATERALARRFASVHFATQSAMWGCQLAPLTREALDFSLDGRLSEAAAAAFFIALCSQVPSELPQEMTLVPLPVQPLARGAARFDRLAEELLRANEARARLESALERQRRETRRLDELEGRIDEAERTRGEAVSQAQQADERARRTEHLLDELAAERADLVARLAAASDGLSRAEGDRAAVAALRREAESARDQAQREREAHLDLSRVALAQLKARVRELESAAPHVATPEVPAARADERRLQELKAELDAQATRIRELDALALEQDARLEAFEALDHRLELARAEVLQRDGRIGELEATLAERALFIDELVEGARALDGAIDALARRRNGEAIEALLALHDELRGERPLPPPGTSPNDGALLPEEADDGADDGWAFGDGEDSDGDDDGDDGEERSP